VSETPIHNLLTVKETSEYLRIPLPTVYYLVQRGKIPAIQIGGRWRIKKSSLDHDILRQDKQGQPTVLVVDDDLGVQASRGIVTWPLK
jgi:excisionase family DNA binding protein